MSKIVQLATSLPDKARIRIYWDDGVLLAEVEAQPGDERLPDGDYAVDEQGNPTTPVNRRGAPENTGQGMGA